LTKIIVDPQLLDSLYNLVLLLRVQLLTSNRVI